MFNVTRRYFTLSTFVSAGCAARVLRLARLRARDTVDGLFSNFTVCYVTLPTFVSAGCAARVLQLARRHARDTVDGLFSNFTVCYGRLPHWCVGTVQCVSVWTQVYQVSGIMPVV